MKIHIALAGSDILYHGTIPQNAISILQAQHFLLRPALTADEAKFGPNLFFLSTARSILSQYFTQSFIVFELDGRKIGQKHKVVPVEFFQDSDLDRVDEKEDRVLSRNNTLSISYVTAIHVAVGSLPNNVSSKQWVEVQTIKRLAKKAKIPMYFYDTPVLTTTNPNKRIQVPFTSIPVKPLPLSSLPRRKASDPVYDPKPDRATLARVVLGPLNTEMYKTSSITKWFIPHRVLRDSLIAVLNDIHNPQTAGILAKMRRHKWVVADLAMYVRAKLMFMIHNTLLTEIVYDAISSTLSVPQQKLLVHSSIRQLGVEAILIQEYKLPYADKAESLKKLGMPDIMDKLNAMGYRYCI